MLKQKRQNKYITKATAEAVAHLDAFCSTRDAEELHQFRVDIKKLSALPSFLKGHPEGGRLQKFLRPVSAIFKKAGDIRTLDVNKELISDFPFIKKSFLYEQQRLRDKKAGKFIAGSKEIKLRMESFRKKMTKALFDVKNNYFSIKYNRQLNKLADSLSENLTNIDKLHDARKKMKMLLYTSDLLPKSILSKIEFNAAYLNKVEHAIGEWHDLVQSGEVLSCAGYANPELFQKLRSNEKRQQMIIEKLVKGFLKKVKK